RGSAGVLGHLVLQARRQERPRELAELERWPEHRRRHALLERPARGAFARRALDALLDDLTPDLDQLAVAHARRARGLAIAAREAAVEVHLRAACRGGAFEHLLDQVDAPAWPVELVAEQLVGRTSGGAETTVHALAQDRLGRLALGRCLELGAEVGLHGDGLRLKRARSAASSSTGARSTVRR